MFLEYNLADVMLPFSLSLSIYLSHSPSLSLTPYSITYQATAFQIVIPNVIFWNSPNSLLNYCFTFHEFVIQRKKLLSSKGDIHFYYHLVSISSLFDHVTVTSYVELRKEVIKVLINDFNSNNINSTMMIHW